MSSRYITIIECPSNLGLKQLQHDREPGVRRLPDWLRNHGFYNLLNPEKILSVTAPPYSMDIDVSSGIRNADAIADYAKRQADILKPILEKKTFSLVIGGDCSILLGVALALRTTGNYGLFFLDGHTDYMPVTMSSTKAAAGLDLFLVTGNGPSKLSNIDNTSPFIPEENVFCVGNREMDSDYVAEILRSKIRYLDLYETRRTGPDNCASDFLKMIKEKKLDGFWVHLDVDVLNDEIMPAVDSRQPDGLSYEELKTLLIPLLSNSGCAGLNITILDHDKDPDGFHTRRFVSEMSAIIRHSVSPSSPVR